MSPISSPFRAFTHKFPHHHQPITLSLPISKALISSSLSLQSFPPSLSLFKSITFQRIPTTVKPPKSLPPTTPSSSSVPSLQPIEELPPKLQEIIRLFQGVKQPKAKYEQLLFYGRNLTPLEDQLKTRENKVEGCVSQVWVRAYLDADKNVWFEADSDSVLTKGLAALLVQGLSGRPAKEILRVSPDFVTLLGLQQSLTPSRNNGFLNMLKLMQRKAAEEDLRLASGSDTNASTLESRGEDESSSSKNSAENMSLNSNSGSETGTSRGGDGPSGGDSGSPTDTSLGGRAERIRVKLEKEINPVELEVEDVSYQHAGHAGARGGDDGTHINLRIVSKEFEGKSMVKRHRLIYSLLQDELQSGLHALSIVAKAPGELEGR